jgi:hypothetical protein
MPSLCAAQRTTEQTPQGTTAQGRNEEMDILSSEIPNFFLLCKIGNIFVRLVARGQRGGKKESFFIHMKAF